MSLPEKRIQTYYVYWRYLAPVCCCDDSIPPEPPPSLQTMFRDISWAVSIQEHEVFVLKNTQCYPSHDVITVKQTIPWQTIEILVVWNFWLQIHTKNNVFFQKDHWFYGLWTSRESVRFLIITLSCNIVDGLGIHHYRDGYSPRKLTAKQAEHHPWNRTPYFQATILWWSPC